MKRSQGSYKMAAMRCATGHRWNWAKTWSTIPELEQQCPVNGCGLPSHRVGENGSLPRSLTERAKLKERQLKAGFKEEDLLPVFRKVKDKFVPVKR